MKDKPNTLVELFNSTCVSLPKVLELTNTRKRKIISRLKEHPNFEWWRIVFQKVEATPFLRGGGNQGWKATFDWLIRNDTNAVRVMEGSYQRQEKQKSWEDWKNDKS